MFTSLLRRLRHKIREGQYVMPLHAEEEMDGDNLTIFDVENSFLTGRIARRQRDPRTREWKYLVTGRTIQGGRAAAVAKLSPTDALVSITVYAD
ncbi:MAG TPA: DUF4258 domain-containing protein [Planctomycetota bacterium]|nr:DUF4258 domain-containing protein [Planctomycetota bacterium]